jgi:hypothetical protein
MPIVLSSNTGGDVGIANYGDLKAQCALWLNRTDLTEAIPEHVRIAESRIRTDLKVRAQETLTTGTLTGDTLAVPSQLIEARRLVVEEIELAYVPTNDMIADCLTNHEESRQHQSKELQEHNHGYTK